MVWIKTLRPGPEQPALTEAMAEGMKGYPPEYGRASASGYPLPPEVARASIVGAHSLVPEVLRHVFAGYRAMLDPALPLSRRDHELIATTVSALNGCHY
jgi:hypothetical protein